VCQYPGLGHERASAGVVPVDVKVYMPGEEAGVGFVRDLLSQLAVEGHPSAGGAVRAC
jgi:hypothetical protein